MLLTRVAARLSKAGAALGAAALALMIALITLQVLSRRVLASPMVVADELSGYLLVITTFSALGYALLNNDHIQVTLLTDRLPPGWRPVLRAIWCLIGLPFLAFLLWRTTDFALDSYRTGTFSVSATNFILWPIQAFIPAGFAVLLLQMLAELVAAVAAMRRGGE
jgi:TRAP-type transport system small permease protein